MATGAQWPATETALDLHDAIGVENFAARYRYLKSLWTQRLARVEDIKIHTSDDPLLSCGIGLIGLPGLDPPAMHKHLYEREHISTWPITEANHSGLWVSPYPFTSKLEIEKFVDILLRIRMHGLPA